MRQITILIAFTCLLTYTSRSQFKVLAADSVNNDISLTNYLFYKDSIRLTETKFQDSKLQPFNLFTLSPSTNRGYLFKVSSKKSDTAYLNIGSLKANIYYLDTLDKWIQITERKEFEINFLHGYATLIPIALSSQHTNQFLIIPELKYYNYFSFSPKLLTKDGIDSFLLRVNKNEYGYTIYLISLTAFMAVLLIAGLLKYFINKDQKLLYLCLSNFFFIVFIFYPQIARSTSNDTIALLYIYLPFIGLVLGIYTKTLFIERLLNFKLINSNILKQLKIFKFYLVALLVVITYEYFFPEHIYKKNSLLYSLAQYTNYALSLYLIFTLLRWKDTVARYIAYSLSVIGVLLIIWYIVIYTVFDNKFLMSFHAKRTTYHIAIVLELVLFWHALSKKEELEKIDKEREKFIAINRTKEEERNRIAKEMHDDIGSSLTSIRLLSETALLKQDNQTNLVKISKQSSDLVNSFNEIIWSINSKNDSLANLISYVRSYTINYFEGININIHINIPENIPEFELSSEIRRNLFLVTKESLNNLVKHSKAKDAWLIISINNNSLKIRIEDNGNGFNETNIQSYSNGLKNMEERIRNIGGVFSLKSNEGTIIEFMYPLAPITKMNRIYT